MNDKLLQGFIFLDLENPLVAWEVYRGSLISSDYINSDDRPLASLRMIGFIRHVNNIQFFNELLFESIRENHFSSVPSRLVAFYAFHNRLDAEYAAKAWGGNNHFDLNNLVEVGIQARNIIKVDANWITNADRHENGLIKENYIPHIKKYWEGKIHPDSPPHWELLVNGKAIVFGADHRNKAYEVIKRTWPDSLSLLELARVAEVLNSSLGHISPMILQTGEFTFKVRYVLDMADATDELFLKKLETFNGSKNYNDMQSFFTKGLITPDLREYEIEFTLSRQALYGLDSLTIHC